MTLPDFGTRALAMILGVAAASWLMVAALRRYALARGVLDRPRDRSSHVVPTPRGGGAGLVAAAIIGYVIATPSGSLDWRIALALAGVLPTAVIGWLDDHGSLPVWPRVSAHLLSGLLILPLAVASGPTTTATVLLAACWLIATVSAINVVNFIDGIDGLIGLQALVFAVHLALLGEIESAGQLLGLALAAASVGFLIWNWAPARIFLGDVGSGAVAVLGLIGGILVWQGGVWPFVAIFLPLFPIFLDATVTIVRRARGREPLTAAHRGHLYQRLANEAGWSHARVSLLYGAAAALATVIVLTSPPHLLIPAIVAYMISVGIFGWLLDRRANRMH